MNAVALLTAFCGKCATIALVDQGQLLNGRLPCAGCGANLQVAPGCSFSEEDRELFDDLKQVVQERTVGVAEARNIALRIGSVLRTGADRGLLEELTTRLPGLMPIQLVAGTNQQARQRALRLLRAIFEAIAHGASSS